MIDDTELLDALCESAGRLPAAVIVAAHPRDEVIGAGSRLNRLDRLLIVHTADGAPVATDDASEDGRGNRQERSQLRRAEVRAALELCGIGAECTRQIGLAEQEVSYHLADLTRALAGILLEAAPQLVLTHAYEGGHPDHDATAFAVSNACRVLRRDGRPAPIIVEFTSDHDLPRSIVPAGFLSFPDRSTSPPRLIRLTDEEVALKRRMLDCFSSQRKAVEPFLLTAEHFRLAPDYSFLAPPAPGALIYERFSSGMTGRLWRSLAADALRDLDLSEPWCE